MLLKFSNISRDTQNTPVKGFQFLCTYDELSTRFVYDNEIQIEIKLCIEWNYNANSRLSLPDV